MTITLRLLLLIVGTVAIVPVAAELLPVLTLTRSGGNVQLSWPTSATDWMPCVSNDLAPGEWRLISAVPSVNGAQNEVTLPITAAREFYQLRHRGAVVPFTTLEAESTGSTTGSVVSMTTLPTSMTWTPEQEASARGYVALTATGQHVEFPNTRAANALVLRHCIPDAPTGGGMTATLSLYVNGVFRQKLTLSSTYNWLYGNGTAGSNGQSNDPAIAGATPHVFWDEERAFITGGLAAGDTLRLQKDADDTAAFYRIDLVDLETAPAPLSPPTAGTYLAITDYGATGADATDDTTAIQACITAAKAQGKIVWMPAGTFYHIAKFTLDGVAVQGAGMWHTSLISTLAGTTFGGNVGFKLAGTGPRVSDLFITSTVTTNRITYGGMGFTNSFNNVFSWRVENVWITHSVVGFWIGGAVNGTVRGCRVRLTYADGINLNNGASGNLVEHNHVRGIGDDGLAILSETALTPTVSSNNTLRFNTVRANWWGHNCDLAGGSGHIIEDNDLADNAQVGVFTINLPSAYPMYAVTSAIIRRNTMLRGGGNAYGQKRGAIWIFPGSTTISGVFIRDNDIRDSIFRGIHLAGTQSQSITFERNVVDRPGENGIQILFGVTGTSAFNSNIVRNLNGSFVPFSNGAVSPGYTVTLSGNSW
jgi:hypothetical protein